MNSPITDHLNRRILVVDDNRAIHEDFRKILVPEDSQSATLDTARRNLFGAPAKLPRNVFTIDSAFQGEEAIGLLRQAVAEGRPYSTAFVDVRMPPGLDGIETAAKLWEIDPALQIVICTAYSDYSWDEMLALTGSRDSLLVLKKPFDAIEILQLAHALADKWALANTLRQRLANLEDLVGERTADLTAANESLRAEIADHARAEEKLLRAQRMESIGILAGGIAHDLNNVLSPIMMAIEILRSSFPDGRADEVLKILSKSAERGGGMVKQVLQFARGMDGSRMVVDPSHVVRDLRQIATDTFPKNIRLQCSVEPGLWAISADPTQLHQVLLNLCVNARDAMPAGGTLSIRAENVTLDANFSAAYADAKAGPHVLLKVTDTGTGMSREVMARIFDPFFTTKEVGKGTGLGLSTTFGIVKSHGGFIDVESEPGQGSTFKVYLPAADAAAAQEEREHILPEGHGELVLVVDDEEAIRTVTEDTLHHYGYRTLSAADGAAATALFCEHRSEIAVVLTDLVMPVMDGR
ncbi:MAG: ATP-binding protein, partial [Chthoniobacteraceae bacterium]